MADQETNNTILGAQSLVFSAAHDAAVTLEEVRNQHLRGHRGTLSLSCADILVNAQRARDNADKEWAELNRISSS